MHILFNITTIATIKIYHLTLTIIINTTATIILCNILYNTVHRHAYRLNINIQKIKVNKS